jgi:hypothetical protein
VLAVVVVVLVVVVVVVVVDIVLLLTHNLPNTEEENTTKYENVALEIKKKSGSLILYLYTLSHLSGRSGHQKLPKMSREYTFNQIILKSGATSSTVTSVSYGMQISRTCLLILGDGMNLLLQTEPNPTDSLGWVKVYIDRCERCD